MAEVEKKDPVVDEKKDISEEELQQVAAAVDLDSWDPSVPFPDDGPEEQQFTIRAVVVGCILGAIVGASNLYLGLKTGFTFGPAIFGAIMGFAILKPLCNALGSHPILGYVFGGKPFGPKENCTVQTAATAAGGLGIIFVSAVPALYRLGLMADDQIDAEGNVIPRSPENDYAKIFLLTLCAAYYGLFFAVPLRRYFVIRMKLIFPTPAASALTIRNLHDSATGAEAGKKKARAMIIAFVGAIVWYILGFFIPGIFRTWHIFEWMARAAPKGTDMKFALQSANDWSWIIEWTPAFIGAGMLSGVNASYSLFFGSFLAWACIGPGLINSGLAVATFLGNFSGDGPNSYFYFSSLPKKTGPTPRYWMLWPGVSMMLFYSFAELAMNWRAISGAVSTGVKELVGNFTRAIGKESTAVAREDDRDPAKAEDQIPTAFWVGGVVGSGVVTILVMNFYFKVGPGETILAIILAFFLAFIGLQSSGDTDINPVGAVAKASQLVFAGVTKSQGLTGPPAQTKNLIGGTIAAAAASQAVDMVGDLKTGYLLNATPKSQFYAQIVGSALSIVITAPLFVLFTKAYPCILYPEEIDKCTFQTPSVAAWAAVATVLTGNTTPIPTSSGIASIVLGIISVISVVIKRSVPERYRIYVPNFNAIGIAFVLNTTTYSTAMALGATLAYFWRKHRMASFEMYGWAIAAGLTAGEGIGGLIVAIFQIAGLKGEEAFPDANVAVYASPVGLVVGCPTDPDLNERTYCG
ncbi:hypothetical protein HDU96_000293 [Phlyctochytrium bullatum]|nr:hypothetical protein HDU96_000293 [Phlyctochytrium bullatum]